MRENLSGRSSSYQIGDGQDSSCHNFKQVSIASHCHKIHRVYMRLRGSLHIINIISSLNGSCQTYLGFRPSRGSNLATSVTAGNVATMAKIWP